MSEVLHGHCMVSKCSPYLEGKCRGHERVLLHRRRAAIWEVTEVGHNRLKVQGEQPRFQQREDGQSSPEEHLGRRCLKNGKKNGRRKKARQTKKIIPQIRILLVKKVLRRYMTYFIVVPLFARLRD